MLSDCEVFRLFATDIHKFRIDPNTYDKQDFIEVCTRNYDKNPYRNSWDHGQSDIHHLYNDWDNKEFEPVNLDKVTEQYKLIIDSFMQTLRFNNTIAYEFGVVNTTVTKTNQYMKQHNHESCAFSCVHYINLKEEHSLTRFINPLIIGQFRNTWAHVNTLMDGSIENSSYFSYWDLSVEEDDFIIFPAYLVHEITRVPKTVEPRITNSVNIKIKPIMEK